MPMHFTTSSCNPAWEKRSKRPTPIRTTKSRGVFHGTPVERKIVAVLPLAFNFLWFLEGSFALSLYQKTGTKRNCLFNTFSQTHVPYH